MTRSPGVARRTAARTYRHPAPPAGKITNHVTFRDAGSVTEL